MVSTQNINFEKLLQENVPDRNLYVPILIIKIRIKLFYTK